MTSDDSDQDPASGKRSKLLKILTAAGLAAALGVLADVSQVFGVSVKDAVDYVRGQHPAPSSAPLQPSAATPSVPPTASPPSSAASAGTGGGGTGSSPAHAPGRSSSPTPRAKVSILATSAAAQPSAHAKITAPADGLTTTETTVTLSITAAPESVAGWVWYVVVKPAHHTTSDYLYRMRPETGSLTVGIGPATGGSGATDDYVIRPALIRSADAATIGGYDEADFAPGDTRYFSGITVHRESQ